MVLTAKRDAPDADTLTLVIRYVIESEEGEGNGRRIGGGAGRRELADGRRRQQRAKEAGGAGGVWQGAKRQALACLVRRRGRCQPLT